MAIQNQTLSQTFQLIIDILCFDAVSQDSLKLQLSQQAINWDAVVSLASSHLVLPAVYCRLKQKSLLGYLPEDLVLYLEELTALNRNRNHTLRTEAQAISQLFLKHQIDYVFIKGIALLMGNYYTDAGERMIGDIDILITSEDLDTAFDLLVAEGYSQFVCFNYDVKNYRHRPRQISETRLGAVELHDQLLKDGYNHLLDKELFIESKEIINEVAIPSSKFLIWNSILATQINNHHSYYGTLNLKGIYDVLVLNLNEKPNLIAELSKQKDCRRFLSLTSIFLPSIAHAQKTEVSGMYQRIFLLKLRFPSMRRMFHKFKFVYLSIQERLQLLIYNKSYRAHILKNKLFSKF